MWRVELRIEVVGGPWSGVILWQKVLHGLTRDIAIQEASRLKFRALGVRIRRAALGRGDGKAA